MDVDTNIGARYASDIPLHEAMTHFMENFGTEPALAVCHPVDAHTLTTVSFPIMITRWCVPGKLYLIQRFERGVS